MAEALKEITEQEDSQKGKFLTFALGKEDYGIEIRYVTEIIGVQPITEMPEVPQYVKGIINLRGKIIPVIDVRIKFGKNAIEYNERTCIIVIDIHKLSFGLIVDKVSEVLSIADTEIVLPPDNKTGFYNRYIKGIGKVNKDIKLLLDCDKLLTYEEVDTLSEIG